MLKYTHLYNTSDIKKSYNLCCIESESSNINLYVNDIFKSTLAPNKGTKYSFIAYRALDIAKVDLTKLLARGTIEADSYTVAERKSIFNDKNYCYIKTLAEPNLDTFGGDIYSPQLVDVNTKYLTAWAHFDSSVDGQYDYLKFNVTQTGDYIFTLKAASNLYLDFSVYLFIGGNWQYLGYGSSYSGGIATKVFNLVAGYSYAMRPRCYYSYGSTRVDYEFSIVNQTNPTTLTTIDLRAPITKYVSIEDNKLVLGDKATKFYFNPKYFNLPQLYLKLYGAVPSDKGINYHYSDSQQLSMINSKVISFSSTESLPIDIDINTFDTTLDSNRFRTTGGSYSLSIDNFISLDDFANFNDKIKLASGTEKLEFIYSPNTTTLYNEQNIPVTTSARIFHYPVTFYNPNKKVLFSFPLNKGINNLAISKTIGSITYNKSLQVTRT